MRTDLTGDTALFTSEDKAGYRVHTEDSIRAMIERQPALAAHLGGSPAEWDIHEIGDGNLNLVFRIVGPGPGLIVKQALPYLRLVGRSWPLSVNRSIYEAMALHDFGELVPGTLPKVLYSDPVGAFIAMEFLQPHVTLRDALLRGQRLEQLADHLASYLACTLFRTSEFCLSGPEKAALAFRYEGNHEMMAVTDRLIFTEPFQSSALNRWTSPELDPLVATLKNDTALLRRVRALRLRFLQAPQALLHGDLHTSSIMVTSSETRIIDPEFVFLGPIGLDVGLLLGDLLLNYFAQAGHHRTEAVAGSYGEWILDLVDALWRKFTLQFEALWVEKAGGRQGVAVTEIVRTALCSILKDAVGFAAVEMMRRIIGLAHVIDFELITDRKTRAACESASLLLSRWILLSETVGDIRTVTAMARTIRSGK